MTGEDLFSEYRRRSKEPLEYGMIDLECVWIWESAAKSISSLEMDNPERQIRSIKAGNAL